MMEVTRSAGSDEQRGAARRVIVEKAIMRVVCLSTITALAYQGAH